MPLTYDMVRQALIKIDGPASDQQILDKIQELFPNGPSDRLLKSPLAQVRAALQYCSADCPKRNKGPNLFRRISENKWEVRLDDSLPRTEAELDKVLASVTRRLGQAEFRKKLLENYGYRCAVSGCNTQEALEAAHITPYSGRRTSTVQNGLLLRSDIHTLYDLYLITVDPKTLRIRVNEHLSHSEYAEFNGKSLGSRKTDPSSSELLLHYKEFLICEDIYRKRDIEACTQAS